jgi:hypothetical protein
LQRPVAIDWAVPKEQFQVRPALKLTFYQIVSKFIL